MDRRGKRSGLWLIVLAVFVLMLLLLVCVVIGVEKVKTTEVIYELQKLWVLGRQADRSRQQSQAKLLVIFVSINDTFRFATVSRARPIFFLPWSASHPGEKTATFFHLRPSFFIKKRKSFSFKPLGGDVARPKDYHPLFQPKTFDFAYFMVCLRVPSGNDMYSLRIIQSP